MSRLFHIVTRLVLLSGALSPVAHAASVVTNYNARADWINADFIGWVRIEEALTRPARGQDRSRVKLRVIERLAGVKAAHIELGYDDSYMAPGREDEIVWLGTEPKWHEHVGKEFVFFLHRGSGRDYEAFRHFVVENARLPTFPPEYQKYFALSEHPRVADLLAKARRRDPWAGLKIGRPRLEGALRHGFRRVEAPHECIERFLRALSEQQTTAAEQDLHRTPAYTTPRIILDARQQAAATDIRKLQVVGEVAGREHALVQVSYDGDKPEPWYLVREISHWRLLNPEPATRQEQEELTELLRHEEVAVLKAAWQRTDRR